MRRNPFNPIDYMVPWREDKNLLESDLPVTTTPPVVPPGGQPAQASPNFMSSSMPFAGQYPPQGGQSQIGPPGQTSEPEEFFNPTPPTKPAPLGYKYVPTSYQEQITAGTLGRRVKYWVYQSYPTDPRLPENKKKPKMGSMIVDSPDRTEKWTVATADGEPIMDKNGNYVQVYERTPSTKEVTVLKEPGGLMQENDPRLNPNQPVKPPEKDREWKWVSNAYSVGVYDTKGNYIKSEPRDGWVEVSKAKSGKKYAMIGKEVWFFDDEGTVLKKEQIPQTPEEIASLGLDAARFQLDLRRFQAEEEKRKEASQLRDIEKQRASIGEQKEKAGKYFGTLNFLNKLQGGEGLFKPSWEEFQSMLRGNEGQLPGWASQKPAIWDIPTGANWIMGEAQRLGLLPVSPGTLASGPTYAPPTGPFMPVTKQPSITSAGGVQGTIQGPGATVFEQTYGEPGTPPDLVPFWKAGFFPPSNEQLARMRDAGTLPASIQSNIARNQAIASDPYEQRLFPLKMQLQRFDAPAMGTPEQNTLVSQMDAIRKEQSLWQESERLKRDKELLAEQEKKTMYNQKLLLPSGLRQPSRYRPFFQR